MRVIAGTHKGRRLHGPKGPGLRPTADRVKEALFSILASRVTGARFLDLFAGTGAIGIEALSRGARSATFVESHAAALRILRANLTSCGLTERADIYAGTATVFLRRRATTGTPYDIVFADPPYQIHATKDVWSRLVQTGMVTPHSIIVIEHAAKLTALADEGLLHLIRQYRYGDTMLSLFEPTRQESGTA